MGVTISALSSDETGWENMGWIKPKQRKQTKMSDLDPLLVAGTPSRWTSRRTTLCCLSLLLLGTLCLATALILSYFLAIVSKHEFTQIEFFPYTDHGDLFWKDGEYFARKGVGRVRVEPHPNVTVDVFVTHTCAEDYNYW